MTLLHTIMHTKINTLDGSSSEVYEKNHEKEIYIGEYKEVSKKNSSWEVYGPTY